MSNKKDDIFRDNNIKLKYFIKELQEIAETASEERIKTFIYDIEHKCYKMVFNDGRVEYITNRELERMKDEE